MEYQKVKSASKEILVKGKDLNKIILDTMSTISKIVGATLGPGGQPVLIERFEHDLPVIITKDGVTVFRSLGFKDPAKQCVMEAARDASIRTASEAGDGTTTATVLAEAIVRTTHEFCKNNPRISPQKVVRKLEEVFRTHIEPMILDSAIKADLSTEEGKKLLHAVARVSANGDTALADAVIECFEVCGDEGNVTISESSGPSHYEVERVDGYPLPVGYEESCGKFYPKFINDVGTQRCVLENPVFIPYHGRLNDTQKIVPLLAKILDEHDARKMSNNIVVVATGFSENVLADFAFNFGREGSANIFPLIVPPSPMLNGQLQYLEDICAITNSALFDPISRPLDKVEDLEDLGNVTFNDDGEWECSGVKSIEIGRFRGTIIGHGDEDVLMARVDELKQIASNAESELDSRLLKERIAKISGGIARLKVIGSSNGELKEKRDRADDAVCAVRGAIKHGCLYGGGWALLKLAGSLPSDEDCIVKTVLGESLLSPVVRLYENCGIIDQEEIALTLEPVKLGISHNIPVVYDCLNAKHVDPVEFGILDSVPAVLESIRNSISIASLLGTLGGTVVFGRDQELERTESRETQKFLRDSNEANDRT